LESLTCPAYPDEIPDAIFFNDVKHDHVLPGQEGGYIFNDVEVVKDEAIQNTGPLVYQNGGQFNPDYLEMKLQKILKGAGPAKPHV
jgi:hypothetical protein